MADKKQDQSLVWSSIPAQNGQSKLSYAINKDWFSCTFHNHK